MIKIHDNVFDQKWIIELSSQLLKEGWTANNVANRNTFPYQESGTHRLLGKTFFLRQSHDNIIYDHTNMNLCQNLINAFDHITRISDMNMQLMEITGNLQFKDMDGSFHRDGFENQRAFILMLNNEQLPKNIGGAFIHKPTNKKVPFEAGRLIEIAANDLHRADAFNKPYFARMSIKWVGQI